MGAALEGGGPGRRCDTEAAGGGGGRLQWGSRLQHIQGCVSVPSALGAGWLATDRLQSFHEQR